MNQKNVFYISNINFLDGEDVQEKIDLSFIPPMSRRKLSLVDKIALSVMHKAYTGRGSEIVFASQYGELDRLNKIISQYQQDNEVSPFTFGGSVHNSVAGQFSLLNKINSSYNALAAGENTFSAGLLESFMRTKDSEVLFCFADAYKEPHACAFTVSASPSDIALEVKLHLSITQCKTPNNFNNECMPDDIQCQTPNIEYSTFKDFIEGRCESFSGCDGVFSIVRGKD